MRTQRYRTALGSARETVAGLRVAGVFGHLATLGLNVSALMNKVIGTLVRVAW